MSIENARTHRRVAWKPFFDNNLLIFCKFIDCHRDSAHSTGDTVDRTDFERTANRVGKCGIRCWDQSSEPKGGWTGRCLKYCSHKCHFYFLIERSISQRTAELLHEKCTTRILCYWITQDSSLSPAENSSISGRRPEPIPKPQKTWNHTCHSA